MKKYFLLFLTAFALVVPSMAQDDSADNADINGGEEEELSEEDKFKGFAFGINLGVYFASKKTGNFYNGSGAVQLLDNPNDVRLYSIAERLSAPPMTNAQFNDLIDQMGGATSFSVPYDSYPLNMRYTPAFNIGMQIRYNFNRYAALVMNINAIKLKAVSQFTLQLYGRGAQVNAADDIELYTITGTEQRFNFNLGYRQGWMMSDYGNFYMQPFASMLGTEIQKNQIFIGNNTYDLFLGASNPSQTFNYQPRTDISFGGGLSTGFEMWVKEKYTIDLGFTMAREKVIMITYEEKVWNKWLTFTFTL